MRLLGDHALFKSTDDHAPHASTGVAEKPSSAKPGRRKKGVNFGAGCESEGEKTKQKVDSGKPKKRGRRAGRNTVHPRGNRRGRVHVVGVCEHA